MRAEDKRTGQSMTGNSGFPARIRFLIRFLGLFAIYYLLLAIPWFDAHLMVPVLELSAKMTAWLVNSVGLDAVAEGITVRGPLHAIAIRRGCDPLDPLALFSAGVLAYPASCRARVQGLLAGGALLFGGNLLRLGGLYWLGSHKPDWFRVVHEEWAPAGLLLLALVLWLAWLRGLREEEVFPANGHA